MVDVEERIDRSGADARHGASNAAVAVRVNRPLDAARVLFVRRLAVAVAQVQRCLRHLARPPRVFAPRDARRGIVAKADRCIDEWLNRRVEQLVSYCTE